MTPAWLAVLVAMVLAAPQPPPQGPAVNTMPSGVGALPASAGAPGDQRVTVYFRGVPSGATVLAQRGEAAPVPMADSGTGVLAADLYGPPARFLQLRLLFADRDDTAHPVYDGLIVLADPAHAIIAFQYQDQQALRLPVAPSARTAVALDQRITWWVGFGWGALSLAWVGILGVMWALRSR
ncbi:MAG: hypothetical protein Q8P41_16430 [Pseudomonadota bacterium]|nr:hypothetical protein [Pseudomonadota bacterium]